MVVFYGALVVVGCVPSREDFLLCFSASAHDRRQTIVSGVPMHRINVFVQGAKQPRGRPTAAAALGTQKFCRQCPVEMEEPSPDACREDVSTGAPSGGIAAGGTDDASLGRSGEPQCSPPRKSRRVGEKTAEKRRGDDGRGRRPRKGDAKRERKKKALADSALMCQYYQDEHGLRRVRPYTYNFETHAKERWLGRTVIDVFSAEFGANPRSHYESVIRSGLLTVNGNKINPDYKLQNSDLVRNRTHRHEPPVAGGDIKIVSESPDEIAVDKPCTVPIHPCGSYRFNTLFYILQKQRPDLSLRVCHRLDRLTSGLTILAKTAERAGVIQTQIGSGKTRKTYLARVRGDFGLKLPAASRQAGLPNTAEGGTVAPLCSAGVMASGEGGSAVATAMGAGNKPVPAAEREPSAVSSGEVSKVQDKLDELWWRYEPPREGVVQDPTTRENGVATAKTPDEEAVEDTTAGSSTVGGEACPQRSDSAGGVGGVAVRVNCPIRVVDPKDGVYGCHPDGKEAQTVVRKVAYDAASDTSVVECTPVHGRTHQIRLHLQWAGHPIANDPCYGGELYFGNPEEKLRAEANSSTEGWKGTSRAKAAAAAAAAATTAAAAAAANAVGTPNSESPQLEKESGGETRATASLDAAAAIVDEAVEGGGGGGNGDGRAGTGEGSGADRNASGASGDKASAEAGAVVEGGEVIEAQRDGEDDEAFMARTCNLCRGGERFTETQLHCHGIWLHALRYQGPDWAFETEMPSWATF